MKVIGRGFNSIFNFFDHMHKKGNNRFWQSLIQGTQLFAVTPTLFYTSSNFIITINSVLFLFLFLFVDCDIVCLNQCWINKLKNLNTIFFVLSVLKYSLSAKDTVAMKPCIVTSFMSLQFRSFSLVHRGEFIISSEIWFLNWFSLSKKA